MQKVIESWPCHWLAKPVAWMIYGIVLAVLYAWRWSAQCVRRLHLE